MIQMPPLIVAFDFSDREEARAQLKHALPEYCGIKVGMELYTQVGPDFIRELKDAGFSVFLDLKWHDIPRTVSRAVGVARRLGVDFVTIHASGGTVMMRAAAEAAAGEVQVFAVTLLTSMDAATWSELSADALESIGLQKKVLHLAQLTERSGITGVVASGHEVAAIKQQCPHLKVLVPGIRLPASVLPEEDQKRVVTPEEAILNGADYLVMGRPIWAAADPADMIRMCAQQIKAAALKKQNEVI